MVRRFMHEASEVDFDDEDAVLAEMAKALDIDDDELRIKEERGLSSFGAGTVYEITIGGGRTGKEWHVVRDHDQMEELALEVVKQDLEQEPEIFNKDFIERHINEDRLRRDLYRDVFDMTYEDLEQMDEDELVRTAEQYGVDQPPDKDDEDADEFEWDLDELADKIVEDKLKNPMEYLEEIYGDEAAAKAIEIAGIDIDAAAKDAVDTDGAEHFLARYDGNSHETDGGLVYWRAN